MSPRAKKLSHYGLAAGWIAAFPVFLLVGIAESVALVLFLSCYANAVTHWDIAQSSAVEEAVSG